MQTFLPYPDFKQSAQCLDNKRLGKQRVECKQIWNALVTGPYQYLNEYNEWTSGDKKQIAYLEQAHLREYLRKTPWYNHPAVQMWKGYERLLAIYASEVCMEWIHRGYKDTLYEKYFGKIECSMSRPFPPWFGDKAFHDSHKSNLLRKDPEWYSQFNWDVPDNLPYVWPTKENYQ